MAINSNDYPNKIKLNLWANKEHNIFYYNFMYEKKRFRGLINLTDKTSWNKKDRVSFAEQELMRVKKQRQECEISEKITLDAFSNQFFKHLPNTKWSRTKINYYKNYISPYIGFKQVVSIRQMHIKEVIKTQENLGLAPRTVKQTIEVLLPIFKTAIINRLISFSPLEGIQVKLPKTKKIVVNASAQLVQIYNAISSIFKDDPFYQALYLFALQGRRRSEILNLKWEDINFQNNYYVLRNTKNNEEQKIFLPLRIKELLLILNKAPEYVFTSRLTGTKIVNFDYQTDKLKQLLGKDFSIHYLRNVIVSAMAEQGLEAIHLSSALGHNDPNTINKYLTLNYLRGSELASNLIDSIVEK